VSRLLRGKALKTQSLLLVVVVLRMSVFDIVLLCRPVVVQQRNLGAQASPSRTRSPDPKVVGESLVDDAQIATPPRGAAESRAASPPVVDLRVACPPRCVEAREGATIGDVEVAASPRIIDVDPISSRPTGPVDVVKDQPQIDQAPRGPGTSSAHVPESSSSSPRLPRREIDWNYTP
jgi:hypothetical protein